MMIGKAVPLAVFLALCLTACSAAGRSVSQSDEILTRDERAGGPEAGNGMSREPEGDSGKVFEGKTGENGETEETGGSEPAVKIGFLADPAADQEGNFNQSVWDRLGKAEEELKIRVSRLDARSEESCRTNLENFAADRYDLVIASGQKHQKLLAEAAAKYPRMKIAALDWIPSDGIQGADQMVIVQFDGAQAAYLAGVAAGMTTKTGTVGWITGEEDDREAALGYAYLAGVLDAAPEAVILQEKLHSFSEEKPGRAEVCRMAEEGADVVFYEAVEAGEGVTEGCQECGILAMGVGYDLRAPAPDMVAALVIKQIGQAAFDVAGSCAAGKLEQGVLTYDLRNEGCDFLPAGDLLSEKVLTALQMVKEKLTAGEITVPATKEEFEAAYGDGYPLD